jgi:hypothetical protein
MSSYTPRRKDNKYEAYGGLQLKTRTVDEDSQSSQPNDRARRQSFNQDSDSYQGESQGPHQEEGVYEGAQGAEGAQGPKGTAGVCE